MTLSPGDTVYIPAGVPSRLLPRSENLQVRLKAEPPAREAVAWYCGHCGALVHAEEVPEGHIAQERYWSAVSAFNAEARVGSISSSVKSSVPVRSLDGRDHTMPRYLVTHHARRDPFRRARAGADVALAG